MVINGKKYIVKVPTGKTTNDFQFDELLPAAREYGEHHLSIYGLCGGMAVMVIECDQEIPEEGLVWLRRQEGIRKVTYLSLR